MQSIHITEYTSPDGYKLGELPAPAIEDPRDVLVKVHAASVNPIDVKVANGAMKSIVSQAFPSKLGFDCAGVVTEVGAEVKRCKVGDEVYVRLPGSCRGAWSEYAKTPEQYIALKPPSLTFEDAASLPLAAMTALQALRQHSGDLTGKTVFIPAGLSATGAYACQLAKNVFKVGKVITTVSTAKVPKVPQLLGENVVDEIIDYTKTDPKSVIPAQSVDFLLDTVGDAMQYLSLMRPKASSIVSIASLPSGDTLQKSGVPVPFYIKFVLNLVDAYQKWRASRWGVSYLFWFLEPNGEDLDLIRGWVEEGELKPIVGTRVHYKDMAAVREACTVVYKAKGGIGKTVISFE